MKKSSGRENRNQRFKALKGICISESVFSRFPSVNGIGKTTGSLEIIKLPVMSLIFDEQTLSFGNANFGKPRFFWSKPSRSMDIRTLYFTRVFLFARVFSRVSPHILSAQGERGKFTIF